ERKPLLSARAPELRAREDGNRLLISPHECQRPAEIPIGPEVDRLRVQRAESLNDVYGLLVPAYSEQDGRQLAPSVNRQRVVFQRFTKEPFGVLVFPEWPKGRIRVVDRDWRQRAVELERPFERFLGVRPVVLARMYPSHGGVRLGEQRIELQRLERRRPHAPASLVEHLRAIG